MRRTSISLFAAIALLVASVAAPASAAPATEPAGTQVVVLGGVTAELDAGEAFHVEHGWSLALPEQAPIGHWGFGLDIDGVDQGKGQRVNSGGPDGVVRRVLFNYPDGLPAGEYLFTGHWYGPCVGIAEAMEEFGLTPVECEFKNAEVDFPLDLLGIPTSVLVIVTD